MIYYKYFKTKIQYEGEKEITTYRDRVAHIFKKKQIYFSNRDQLNDPFEGKPNIFVPQTLEERQDAAKKFVEIQSKNQRISWKAKQNAQRILVKKLSDPSQFKKFIYELISNFGIFCVSKKYDDLLMWAHYAEAYTGLSLGFEIPDQNPINEANLFKVHYAKEYPTITFDELALIENYAPNDPNAPHNKILSTKSDHWDYEEEYRMFRTPADGGAGLFDFPPDALKRLICGALMSSEDKIFFKKLAADYEHPIEIFEAKISKTEYKVVIPGLNDK